MGRIRRDPNSERLARRVADHSRELRLGSELRLLARPAPAQPMRNRPNIMVTGRALACRVEGEQIGPRTNMVNLALYGKHPFPLNEAREIEFRIEAFNFFNRKHFGLPNSVMGNRNAGVIGGTSQHNR